MKVTKKYLRKLILEEIQEQQQTTQDIKNKLLKLAQNLSGIQRNEIEMVDLFISMIDLAKKENINVSEFKRRLGMTKAAAEKIAK